MEYWFNTKTGQVQTGGDPGRARSADLLGPYPTEEEAARAYDIAAERTAKWDEEDRAEQEWKSGDAETSGWDNNPLND